MKLGIIAYASPSGLGIQTYDYYRFLQPAKTLLVDLSPLNNFPVDYSKYTTDQIGEVQVCKGIPQLADVLNFCKDIDVLLIAETPLNHFIINRCREQGIKTILHYNYEFLDYLQNPSLPKPDLLLAPSLWHWDEMVHNARNWGVPLKYLPCPVNRKALPFTPRTSVKKFLHIAGHETAEDRNGTDIVHEAIKLTRSTDIEFVIRTQRKITTLPSDRRVKIIVEDVPNYADLYAEGDCLLLPRRYGGQSLPLNEAMSTGMLPLMPNIAPQNIFLPTQCLLPATLSKTLLTRTPIAVYDVDPRVLAARIDTLATAPAEDVRLLSDTVNELAQSISWDELKPEYDKTLKEVLDGAITAAQTRYSQSFWQA